MAIYTPWLTRDDGQRLAPLDRHYGFSYVKKLNGAGWFSIAIPDTLSISPDVLVSDSLQVDRQVQFWRESNSQQQPAADFVGFLRKWSFKTTGGGDTTITLRGPDQNELLARRIVAYAAGTEQAKTTADSAGDFHIDGSMVDIVRENMGASATDTDRDLSANGFSVRFTNDRVPTPEAERAFAWREIPRILTDLNQTSRTLGTEIYPNVFVNGVDADGTVVFEFSALDNAPGGDRSWTADGVVSKSSVFGLRWGNLVDPELEFDYSKEINYVYVGGPGEGIDRQIVEVSDATRVNASIWNRREKFVDARNETNTAQMTAKGNDMLNRGRPIVRFNGKIMSTEQTPYGEWGLGTRVTIEYQQFKFNGIVRNVHVVVDANGVETVTSNVEWEAFI